MIPAYPQQSYGYSHYAQNQHPAGGYYPPQPMSTVPYTTHFSPPATVPYAAASSAGYFPPYHAPYQIPPYYPSFSPPNAASTSKSSSPAPQPASDVTLEAVKKLLEEQKLEAQDRDKAIEAAKKAEREKIEAEKAAADQRAAENKKFADDATAEAEKKAAKALEEEKTKAAEELKKAKEEAEKELAEKVAAAKAPPPAEKKAPIKFKDAVGRKFQFPYHLCATWDVSNR